MGTTTAGSPTATFDNFSLTLAPANPPSKLVATKVSSTQVNLSWTAASGSNGGYDILRGTYPGGEGGTPINATPVTTTTYSDTTVSLAAPGSGYYYTVVAVNGDAFSNSSNEASVLTPLASSETGTFTKLSSTAQTSFSGVHILGNGSVIAQTSGSGWSELTPSSTGSYTAGTWSTLASMAYTRTYYSGQILQNGDLFVAGGEYGTGGSTAELYNPLTNTWTDVTNPGLGSFVDSGSDTLPNGNVLITAVSPTPSGSTQIYNPSTGVLSQGAQLYRGGDADEQTLVKLPDGSLLSVDGNSTSERYIPSLNQWVNDGSVPVVLWGWGGEMGPAFLLPSGQGAPDRRQRPDRDLHSFRHLRTWNMGARADDPVGPLDNRRAGG